MIHATIRPEHPADRADVRVVNELAFGQPGEANLVEALHVEDAAVISLVAEIDREVVGHILFSRVTVEHGAGRKLLGGGPMCVVPDLQRQGIGTQLVREGLARCAAAGFDGVVVVGHPDYYPRFGFVPASRFGLCCEYDVQDDVFMALALPGRSLAGVSGLVRYHEAFALV